MRASSPMRLATHPALNPLMRLRRVAALIVWTAILFTSATHAQSQSSTAQTVSQIAGSIIQSTGKPSTPAAPPSVHVPANAPRNAEDIKAVCLTSGANTAGCDTHAPYVAVCDVDDVGLAGCLQKYAASLVKHAAVAKHVYQFADHDNDPRAITVLVNARQTEQDAQRMASGE